MKTVNEVLGKVKGEGKVDEILAGKGSFSATGFGDLVSAMANDTTFSVPTYGKDGSVTGSVNVSELIREDVKKTIAKAGYPQKTEIGVLDTAEIYTAGLSKALPFIVMEQLKSGKKFDLPTTAKSVGSVYLKEVPGGVKESAVRDPQTQANLGTSITTSKDCVQVRTKSGVPSFLQTKVRKDVNGNVIK